LPSCCEHACIGEACGGAAGRHHRAERCIGALIGVGHAADDADVVATITDERISESSGLVQSSRDPALAYTVNDSGSGPVVYVVDLATGDVVGTATLSDVQLVDAEAMAIGADRMLYVADIGDNEAVRRGVDLYAIRQPGRGDVTVSAVRHRLRYADGAHDAESLVSDAAVGSFHLVTKGLLGGDVYRLGELRTGDRVTVARLVDDAQMPGLATDADVLAASAGLSSAPTARPMSMRFRTGSWWNRSSCRSNDRERPSPSSTADPASTSEARGFPRRCTRCASRRGRGAS
jgi:hypothetical protein